MLGQIGQKLQKRPQSARKLSIKLSNVTNIEEI